MPKMQKDLDEKGEIGRMKPIGKFFRETRGRTGNRGLRRIAKQKATGDRWLFYVMQGSKFCLRGIKQGKLWGKGALFAGDGE